MKTMNFPKHMHHLTKLKSGDIVESLAGESITLECVTSDYLFLIKGHTRYLTVNQLYNFLSSN